MPKAAGKSTIILCCSSKYSFIVLQFLMKMKWFFSFLKYNVKMQMSFLQISTPWNFSQYFVYIVNIVSYLPSLTFSLKNQVKYFTPICLKCNKSRNAQLVLTNTKHFSNFLLCFQLENYIEDRMLNRVNG